MVSKVITKLGLEIISECEKLNCKIGGPGIIVEIDESKFGKVNTTEGTGLMRYDYSSRWQIGHVRPSKEKLKSM